MAEPIINVTKGRKGFQSVPVAERFWQKVDKGGKGGCWLWCGSKDIRGYGQIYLDGRKQKAHRVAWLLTNGHIPHGKMACHKCDNPPCVNPDHIFWGTMSDNIRDAVAKGRHKHNGDRRNKTHCIRGHPFSGDNLIVRYGWRKCRQCQVIFSKNHRVLHPRTEEQKKRALELQRIRRARAALTGEKK